MNKLSKRTLLLAVALCVLGIILFAIGAGTGGIRDLASAGVGQLAFFRLHERISDGKDET